MNDQKIDRLKMAYAEILAAVDIDLSLPGLRDTPARAANAFQEITRGYRMDLSDLARGAIFDADTDQLVVVKDIELYSVCEHHLLPFVGKCNVGYIPNKKIIGLSKIPQVVSMYASQLQIQESLTEAIAKALHRLIHPRGIAVMIEALHLCMVMRGTSKSSATLNTLYLMGDIKENPNRRDEFFKMIQ